MSVNVDDFISQINDRIARIEAKVGLDGGVASSSSVPASTPSTGASSSNSAAYTLYEAYMQDNVDPFVEASKAVDEELSKLGIATKEAFVELGRIIKASGECKKPSNIIDHMKELQAAMKHVQQQEDRKSTIDYKNHYKSVFEGLPALMFPSLPSGFASHVESMYDASTFYINRVRVQYKNEENGKVHLDWCTALTKMYKELFTLVSDNFKTGLEWNPKGKEMALSEAPATSAKESTPAKPTPAAKPSPLGGGGMANVFAQLSKIDQSGGKTAGLKHVTKDMKTKNQPKVSAPVPVKAAAPAPKATAPMKHDPVFQLQGGKKWMVEYQTSMVTIEEDQVDLKQTVYIYGCDGATVIVKGKCNSITVDNCKNTKVLFNQVIGVCEVVNSKKLQLQVEKTAPTISVDKTDGIVIYLSKESVHETQILSSKSSEMNVSFPGNDDDGAYVEKAIPEQFVHKINPDLTIDSDVSDLYKTG